MFITMTASDMYCEELITLQNTFLLGSIEEVREQAASDLDIWYQD